jgi:hypothetical protein
MARTGNRPSTADASRGSPKAGPAVPHNNHSRAEDRVAAVVVAVAAAAPPRDGVAAAVFAPA